MPDDKQNGKQNGKQNKREETPPGDAGMTKVNMNSEVIRFSEMPKGLKFYIDAKNRVWAQFTDAKDKRRFPFEHPVIQAVLYRILMVGKSGPPKKEELYSYKMRCLASAVAEFRDRDDPDDLILQRETAVEAIELHLFDLTERGAKKSWKASPTDVRKKLVEIATAKENDTSEWGKGNHFTEYLELRKQYMKERNIKFEWGKKNGSRYHKFSWIDKSKVPALVPDVGRPAPGEGRDRTQPPTPLRPSREESDDFLEDDEEVDPGNITPND